MISFVSCSTTVTLTQMLISVAALLVAYVSITSFIGFYRAWIADKMGDSSAVEAGFLTLNPRKQISIEGLMCLLIFRFGWGATQPHQPTRITGNADSVASTSEGAPAYRYVWIKLFMAYLSSAILHLLLAIVEVAALLCMFGKSITNLADTAMLHGNVSYDVLAQMYPADSSLKIFLALILIAAIYIHVFSAVFNFLFRGAKIFMIYLAERSPRFAMHHDAAKIFLGVAVILFFLTPQIRHILVVVIGHMGLLIARLVGAL